MPAGAESFDRMETMDETKPDNNDPHCENGAANHVGEEDAHGEAAAAGEEIERLAPLPIPVSTRPTLNSLTSGRPKTMKRRAPSRRSRREQIPEVQVIPLVEDDEETNTIDQPGTTRALSERKKAVESESDSIQRFSSMRPPRQNQRPPSFLAELGKAQGEKARRAPQFLAELNKAQKNMNPAPKAMTSPTFHNELGSVFTRRLGGSNSGSSPGQVVNSWTKSKSREEEEKAKGGQSKQGEKEDQGGKVRFQAKTDKVAKRDVPTKENEVPPMKARNTPQFLADLGQRQRDMNPAPIAMTSSTFHATLSDVNAMKKEVGSNPPENELANLWAKKRKNTTSASSKNQEPASNETSIKQNSGTRDVKKTTGVVTNPAENELANVWAKKKNLSVAEEEKKEGAGLRVLPPCVRASQEEEALLAATKVADMQETCEPAAVRRTRAKSIKLGSSELVLEGSGGKGQALFMKMAQTNPE